MFAGAVCFYLNLKPINVLHINFFLSTIFMVYGCQSVFLWINKALAAMHNGSLSGVNNLSSQHTDLLYKRNIIILPRLKFVQRQTFRLVQRSVLYSF